MKRIVSFFKDGIFEEILGCIAVATVIIPVIINIFNRSVLKFYSGNLEAIALLAYVWLGYGFFGYLYKKDAHVDMKFIVNTFSPKLRAVFDVIRDLLIFIMSAYLCYWGVILFIGNLNRHAMGTNVSLSIGYASIVFGFFSGAIRSVVKLARRFFEKKEATA